ncbi:hypothetical protein AVCANL279_07410 [Campylobacter canadensis]|uniref:hypothetical protein n=1 Tax=Campylobacter canadensis TaxID=449520 RepID=UPI001556CAD0|nr:hypothetical protein [Campylobacter canadensis]MBZ7995156.1 hypothetical protein [Campylobacter canadensis]MBZ7997146.1 hypothetical protein [Campylobacter canadensis]MBZ8000521.1 hypothetical protein [Campylobacter canadensis]MBZ8003832.1 hypothetical protein [Campylobacter canadensis]
MNSTQFKIIKDFMQEKSKEITSSDKRQEITFIKEKICRELISRYSEIDELAKKYIKFKNTGISGLLAAIFAIDVKTMDNILIAMSDYHNKSFKDINGCVTCRVKGIDYF